jgi:glycine/D-amino acid oxidase-like deaminating enzyme
MQPVSYWWTTRPYTPEPALQGEATADVAIIGGGFTGLSTAYHLKTLEPSIDVLLLEGEAIAAGASGRNAGFGMTLFGLTLATNAFSVRFPELYARQVPIITQIALTEPLGARLEALGWQGREGLEDARNLIHYRKISRPWIAKKAPCFSSGDELAHRSEEFALPW